ncbi:putative CUB domain protein [Trichinella spiralis]|uniref:putative CUB domain protein n=1 Tax=Trichinella spiralis TaxID=6334 RepID=UPI0001EFEAF7|nr:putative CUB domain protein [Trichinella spiralis]
MKSSKPVVQKNSSQRSGNEEILISAHLPKEHPKEKFYKIFSDCNQGKDAENSFLFNTKKLKQKYHLIIALLLSFILFHYLWYIICLLRQLYYGNLIVFICVFSVFIFYFIDNHQESRSLASNSSVDLAVKSGYIVLYDDTYLKNNSQVAEKYETEIKKAIDNASLNNSNCTTKTERIRYFKRKNGISSALVAIDVHLNMNKMEQNFSNFLEKFQTVLLQSNPTWSLIDIKFANCNNPVLTDIEGSIVTPNLYLGYQSEVDFCFSNPCKKPGTDECINLNETFFCKCNEGYSGSLCELSACDFHPTCRNNGICLVNDDGLAACKCKASFTGYDCSSVRCNDIFDEETGSLNSPSFPVDGSSSFQCQYRFIAKDRKGFLFDFKNVKLRSTYFDNVYIFSSWNPIDNDMIYSFNGIRDDFEISVRASKALIILSGSADPMENDYGFELQYSSTFGNDLHSGCTSKETCISFNKSIAHVGDEGNTNADYKKENDFCNPNPCMNNGKCISLSNDFKCQCPPFYFGGKRCEIINCQNIRMDSKSGFIVSPGYPNEYLSNLNCSWIFALNEATMEYSFQSLMFNVEGPQNLCSNDYLEFDSVEDHSRKMRHCGVLESAPLQLEYPNPLIVRFVTDEDVEEDGFFINYRHEKSILEQFQGNVCTWSFESSAGGFVDLYIEHFKSNDCQKNYLQILDVDLNGQNEIICEISYKKIKSPQNNLVINVFMENKSDVTFKANYKMYLLCDDHTCSFGNGVCIHVDGKPRCACKPEFTGERCQFKILGKILQYSHGCVNESIEIFTLWGKLLYRICLIKPNRQLYINYTSIRISVKMKAASNSVVLARIFTVDNLSTKAAVVCSNQSYCFNKEVDLCSEMQCNTGHCVSTNNTHAACECPAGFTGSYCEERIKTLDAPSGVIKSPHFPSNYPDNSECSWKIVTNLDSLVWLRFLLLDIEGIPGQCHFDFVKIYNGENSASELLSSDCGYKTEITPPIKLDIVKNIVTVHFVTDSSVNSRGFVLLWNITSGLCRNVKCPLHSVCELGQNGAPICTCDFGYYGEKCEEVDHCLYVTCANGGTCKTHGNSFHCICPSGITGLLCDEDIDECIENPCKNGGICVNNSAWIVAPEKSNKYAQLNPLLVDLVDGEKIQIFDGNYWNISHDVQLIAEFDKDVETMFPVRAYQNWLSVFFWATGTFSPEKKLMFDASLTSSESPPGCNDPDCKYPILKSFVSVRYVYLLRAVTNQDKICTVKRLGLPWLKLFHWKLRRDSECATTIYFGQKGLVNITFIRISFSGYTSSNGYIEVYDGDQNSNILIGKFTEYTPTPFSILTSSKIITVKYVRGRIYFGKSLSFEMIIESHLRSKNNSLHSAEKLSKWNSSDFYEEKSFQVKELTVWKEPVLYEQNINVYDISKFKEITSASGVLVSPGYPRRYRPLQYYTTRFVAPPGNVFSFAFHSLDLEYPWRNVYCFDAVVFIDPINNKTLQQYILKICGNLTADAKQNFVISSGNEITVAFYSDDESEYTGFELHFQTYANRCLNHSCPPHSSCVSYPESYNCHCNKGYAGFDCQEVIDQCSSSPCVLGHGICANKPDGSFVCMCKEGYTGKHCEHDLICPLNYCHHNGTCERESGKPRCICERQFSGPRCEQEPYPPSLDCKWTITTNNVWRYIYEIHIRYLDLECGWDYVKIQLSNDEIITLCQAEEKTVYSDNSTLNMWFHSDISKAGNGFYIIAEAIINPCVKQPCGNNFICQVTGPNSRNCVCEPGYTGKECNEVIDICADVDCKNGGSCYADKLNFTCVCRKGYRGKFCEIQSNPCIPNPCGHFGICKQVDIAKHTCSCILPAYGNNCRECSEYEIIVSHSGMIKSPEYPFSYPNEMQCAWSLNSILDAGSALNSSCSDGIVIYASSGRQIKRFCGYEIPKSLFVNETKIRITTETSRQLQHDVRRFALSYAANFDFCKKFPCNNNGICENSIALKEARSRSCQCRSKAYHGFSCETRKYFKCGKLLESKPSLSGIVATPDFPLPYNSSYCKWSIQVPKDHIIEITFTTLETYRNCPKCCTGADQILLEDQNGHIISKYQLIKIKIQSDHVVIVFNAKQTSNTGIGFHLLYRADDWCNEFKCENGGTCAHSKNGPICLCTNETTGQHCEKAKCGGIIRHPLIGTITSPKNFSTNYYFKGTDCEWEFIAPEGTCVHLKFHWIDLSCSSYYAAFGMRLCFEPATLEVVSLKNNLVLSYHSEKNDDFEHYVFDACSSLPRSFCGEGRCVNVGDSFYCECFPGWTGEVCSDVSFCALKILLIVIYLEINYCDSSPCIYGTCHSLRNGYYCSCIETYEYYSYGPQCEFVACKSITLSNDHGILQSPFYPEPSPSKFYIHYQLRLYSCKIILGNIDCNWEFYAEQNKMIIIDIEVADFNSAYCATDYLAIFDQAKISEINQDKPQELLCSVSSELSSKIMSVEGYAVKLVLHSIGIERKFAFSYNFGPCQNLKLPGSVGAFNSPGFPHLYPSNVHCSWRIKNRSNSTAIMLTMKYVNIRDNSPYCDDEYIE